MKNKLEKVKPISDDKFVRVHDSNCAKNELIEEGLKVISEGRVSAFIDFSQVNHEFQSDPLALVKPFDEEPMTLLEYTIRKIRGVAKSAVDLYGKNYPGTRDAIILHLMFNEKDFDRIYYFLKKKRHFDYKGVTCIPTVYLL